MAGFRNHIILLLVLISLAARAQQSDRISNVQQIYATLEDKTASLQDLALIAPNINWEDIKAEKEEESRYAISLSSVLKNNWISLAIRDLQYENLDEDVLVVTGTAEGRNASECEYISSRFKHYWVFKNDKIIKFQE